MTCLNVNGIVWRLVAMMYDYYSCLKNEKNPQRRGARQTALAVNRVMALL